MHATPLVELAADIETNLYGRVPPSSAVQVCGSIGMLGPAPKSSPASVDNPVACSPPFSPVPAKRSHIGALSPQLLSSAEMVTTAAVYGFFAPVFSAAGADTPAEIT
jgi:hypothetical protein